MATTLIPPAASAEKTPAAMPGVPCMPSPTTAIVAMLGAHLDAVDLAPRDLAAELALERRRARPRRSGSGTLKQIECSEEACEIRETEIRRPCSAAKVRAAMPGTPSMPLPVTVRSAWPPAAVSAFTGFRPAPTRSETSVPGEVGVGERPHEDRDPAPGDGDERARVQHLGAVVRQLRRLARVELGNDPRVGHHAGVGGEQAGHVLPERDPLGAEPPGEQRGGEIGAAATQRGDLAVRAWRR